ncbi:OmpA family protein [Sphingomonas histidinilytica]|uniref:OmpA family protein n=1 Tax=Rhizorhabdus histidinilytica TaxID=439228 RepID=UPI001AD9F277|nr:OmpA family protein [Rhizorhabdus histidinilytica]MBO9375846.1 OmpA family protein [Rhizorhabdus histidinilytica]
MRRLALLTALAATALAGPAFARDNSWYVGIEGGVMQPQDTKFNVGPSPLSPGGRTTIDNKLGYDVDAILGYDFGMFRLEEEISYKRDRVKSITTGPSRTPAAPGGFGAPPGVYPDASGKNISFGVMINGLLDFGNEDGLSAYVGGGAGIAALKLHDYNVSGGDFLDYDLAKRFAWQAIAGVRYAVSSHVDVGLKYRYFNVTKVRPVDVVGAQYSGKWRSHSALLSLIYNIGAPAAPPPPPPVVETPGPFIVFFDWDKSDITAEAASILDNAANAYATTGQARVQLAGHADKSGSDQYNVGLSQRRADAVKAYLAGKGVPDSAITTEAFGESRPLVETADGVREPQNRRVEITFGTGM